MSISFLLVYFDILIYCFSLSITKYIQWSLKKFVENLHIFLVKIGWNKRMILQLTFYGATSLLLTNMFISHPGWERDRERENISFSNRSTEQSDTSFSYHLNPKHDFNVFAYLDMLHPSQPRHERPDTQS